MSENPPIGVIGVGWVGLVTGACFAELGHDVWLRDIDAAKLASLREGKVPIHEPGLQELVAKNEARLHFEAARAGARARAPAVRLRRHAPDLVGRRRPVACRGRGRGAARFRRARGHHEEHRALRNGRKHRRRLGELGKDSLGYAANPEFLQEGSAVDDFTDPDRVVIGSEPRSEWSGAPSRSSTRRSTVRSCERTSPPRR